jgi:membrane-bound metal-dependent hydrolase YbcI (DUF457 family)
LQHACVGLAIGKAAALCGGRLNWAGLLLGSVLPDIDFVFLVPWLGRVRGHRTITHAPLFQVGVAWVLRKYGFWAVFIGQFAHSLVDSLGPGMPRGVAWLWPLIWRRI